MCEICLIRQLQVLQDAYRPVSLNPLVPFHRALGCFGLEIRHDISKSKDLKGKANYDIW